MSNSRSRSRTAVADAGSQPGGGFRVPGEEDSTCPSRKQTLAVWACRKWTVGYWPLGDSMRGTSIRIGSPAGGQVSNQVPAVSAKAMVELVADTWAMFTGVHTGCQVGGA